MPAKKTAAAKPITVGGLPVAVEPVKAAAEQGSPFARLASVRKAVVAFLVGGLGWVATCYIPDGHVTRAEWYALAVVVVGVLGVHQVPNTEPVDSEAGMGLLEFIVAVFALLILLVIGLAIAGRIH